MNEIINLIVIRWIYSKYCKLLPAVFADIEIYKSKNVSDDVFQ